MYSVLWLSTLYPLLSTFYSLLSTLYPELTGQSKWDEAVVTLSMRWRSALIINYQSEVRPTGCVVCFDQWGTLTGLQPLRSSPHQPEMHRQTSWSLWTFQCFRIEHNLLNFSNLQIHNLSSCVHHIWWLFAAHLNISRLNVNFIHFL